MTSPIISTHGLNYAFGRRQVLHNLSLSVPQASIFGFLGPNGAGKTTTIRVLLGLIRAEGGKVELFGRDIRRHRLEVLARTGALIESPSLYKHLTGFENLEITRRLLNVDKKRIGDVLETVRLTKDAHRRVKEYSLGMNQRLSIALALLHNPDLLILDEPTNGLDPAGIREIRELIISLNRDLGKTIFVSSHLLSEIEKTVTHLAIINGGSLLFQGPIGELRELQTPVLSVQTDDNESAFHLLIRHDYDVDVHAAGKVNVRIRDVRQIAGINQLLVGHGIGVYGLQTNQENLEELFLTLTHTEAQP
jgi:ABC-2 type transport system ATP-binding protein